MEGQMKTVWGSVPIYFFYLILYINKSKNNVVPTYLNQIQKKKMFNPRSEGKYYIVIAT